MFLFTRPKHFDHCHPEMEYLYYKEKISMSNLQYHLNEDLKQHLSLKEKKIT